MKKFLSLVSLILCFTMLFSMLFCLPVQGATSAVNKGTITSGKEYKINLNSLDTNPYGFDYTFKMSANGVATFDLKPSSSIQFTNSGFELFYYVENSKGEYIHSSLAVFNKDNKSKGYKFVLPLKAGTYTLNVQNFSYIYNNSSYYVSLSHTAKKGSIETEPNNDDSTADTLSLNTTYSGVLQRDELGGDIWYDDYDCYKIKLSKGKKYRVTLSNISSSFKNDGDLFITYGPHEPECFLSQGDGVWKSTKGDDAVTAYLDLDTSSRGGTYYISVCYQSNMYTPSFPYTLKISELKKPATPKVKSVENTSSGVKVTWGKVSGADKYLVYRKIYNSKTKKWSGWSKLTSKVTASSYTDKTAKSGTYYTYTVKAQNEAGYSGYTSGLKTYFLSTPKLSSATSSKSGITIKWGKVTGASRYYVYRKTTGGWKKIATAKGKSKVSYLDKTAKKGTTYKYTVRAYYSSYKSYYNTSGLKIKDKY